MYHIKPDKRSRSSAAEIARGLQECLKTTPLKSITVSDIHRVTGISRATFYRLFDTPEDVLHYQLEQMVEQSNKRYSADVPFRPQKILEDTIALGMEQHDFLKALVDNDRFDLLYRYTEKSFRVMDAVYSIFPVDMKGVEREYIIAHLSMDMVATLITWAKNGRKETAAEVVEYLKRYVRILWGMVENESAEQ